MWGKASKTRPNGLSRRRQGFKSPWGRQTLKLNNPTISRLFEIKIGKPSSFFYPFFYPKFKNGSSEKCVPGLMNGQDAQFEKL